MDKLVAADRFADRVADQRLITARSPPCSRRQAALRISTKETNREKVLVQLRRERGRAPRARRRPPGAAHRGFFEGDLGSALAFRES